MPIDPEERSRRMRAGRNIEQTAGELLRLVLAREMAAPVVGDLTSAELARLAASVLMTCPACGATAWCNIDCKVCAVGDELCAEVPA